MCSGQRSLGRGAVRGVANVTDIWARWACLFLSNVLGINCYGRGTCALWDPKKGAKVDEVKSVSESCIRYG